MAKVITNQNFEAEVINAKGKVLVDFWATWCGPCKRQGPIIEEMAAEGFAAGKVDVDENPELASRFGIMSIPTLIIFENGKEAKRLVGLHDKATLVQEMK